MIKKTKFVNFNLYYTISHDRSNAQPKPSETFYCSEIVT